MILLWGLAGDGPIDAVAKALAARGAPFVLFDQRRSCEARLRLDFGRRTEGTLAFGDVTISLGDVAAIYARPYEANRLPAIARASAEARRGVAELEDGLWAFCELTDARVINRASAMATNNSKPMQARALEAHGFRIPETLITTDPEEARRFWGRHRDVIYKSVSGCRSIVAQLSVDHLARLDDVIHCPTQFQKRIPGVDYRVHVVGTDVFAVRVESDATDYRYAARSGKKLSLAPATLPSDVSQRCIDVTRALGLLLSGIDLRRTPEGEWYAFEVNPSPCFTYYEEEVGQPLTARVASLLADDALLPVEQPTAGAEDAVPLQGDALVAVDRRRHLANLVKKMTGVDEQLSHLVTHALSAKKQSERIERHADPRSLEEPLHLLPGDGPNVQPSAGGRQPQGQRE
ncbi:MAG TPA: hypothetical protein VGL13_16045 [Polyangiaceae bacterium]